MQGVVIVGSNPYLYMNKISHNKANGLMLIKHSQPTLICKLFYIQPTIFSIMTLWDYILGIRAMESSKIIKLLSFQ